MKTLLRGGLAVVLPVMLAACDGPASSSAPIPPGFTPASRPGQVGAAIQYTFTTLDDPIAYSSFNRLLGINNVHRIVGYYGSGASSEPSVGYAIVSPYGPKNYHRIVYPKAVDTVPTALDNEKTIAGYYTDKDGKTLGFTYENGIWASYQDPNAKGDGTSTKLFSLNDSGTAVGCYDAGSQSGCFTLVIATGDFDNLKLPGSDAVPTGINGAGDLVGYTTESSGTVVGFLLRKGTTTELSYPGAVSTEFLGVTVHDYIVGCYVDQGGAMHGFLVTEPTRPHETTWQSIDDPNGIGTTVVTSVNLHGDLVGYYVDGSGNTDGFLATPSSK